MNLRKPHRSNRWQASALVASVALALGACGAMESRPSDDLAAAPPFAPGWQEHTGPLFEVGPGPTPGTSVWLVSSLLPRGRYQVISREGDRARLVDGHGFEIDNSVYREIRLILPGGVGNAQALDERWIIAKAPTKTP
jgi:hypothetical protein